MQVYTTEEEQIEKIKKFLREYGGSILIGIIIALIVSLGWQYWRTQQMEKHNTASNIYEQMLQQAQSNNYKNASVFADTLINDYQNTPYAALAALEQAKIALDVHDLKTAADKLEWASVNTRDAILKDIALLRLARVLIAEGDAKSALSKLDQIHATAFISAVAMMRGDAYTALKDYQQANQTYQQALTTKNPFNLQIIQLKQAGI